jgi:hypothetical protein
LAARTCKLLARIGQTEFLAPDESRPSRDNDEDQDGGEEPLHGRIFRVDERSAATFATGAARSTARLPVMDL